ncbi:MAG: HAD family hydrolase [Eubacterium sp.]|nr:HAD family hydrolase [Eubacterium sp.]
MIKAVLFDFDETLQDRTLAFEGYMDTFFKQFRPEITGTELEKCKEDMRVTGKGGYVNRVDWYNLLIDMWNWKDAPPAEELAHHYDYTFGDHNVIFDNSEPLLKELKARGYTLGVITNGPSHLQHHKLETSGLIDYFDIIVVSGDVGVHKPDPKLFIYAAEKYGLKPEECVYVGDHPVNDIQGALAAGMKAIRMNWGWFENQNLRDDVPVITDIIDVLKYV